MTTDDWGGKSPTSLSSSRRKTDNKRCSHSQQIAAVGEAVIKRSRLPALSRYQQAPLANSVFSPPDWISAAQEVRAAAWFILLTFWRHNVNVRGARRSNICCSETLNEIICDSRWILWSLDNGMRKKWGSGSKNKLGKDFFFPPPVLLPSSWVNKEPLEPCNQLCPTQTLSHESKRRNTNR